ncbi:alpha/beta hydrolase [Elizabethkingia argentiflava]|uniref:Alpha/beta hydrolase n=1 Tax=Elizabethkingia argenteiflava TaxID=2681556 RepID=A0A845PYN9_9FLAO|nr:alpha/beta hydrolase [Elizabethkingia argenteiflava]NAW51200.1 alpha/beta hydrolase [Elizabethkingia argenteiflava]
MISRFFYLICSLQVILLFSSCSSTKKEVEKGLHSAQLKEYDVPLFDDSRTRSVPITIYDNNRSDQGKKIVIFNHGYGFNKGGDYKVYSKLCKFLAKSNYFVISIQHELPNDDLLSMEGDLYKTRMPNWQKGESNINFVINECRKKYPYLNWKDITLVGHSNGGDMAMLFAKNHRDLIKNVVSLDHRRFPIPRVAKPRILSLRGCDYPADSGVIPTPEEYTIYGIKIVYLKYMRHTDMDDKGTQEQSDEINKQIINFLNERLK